MALVRKHGCEVRNRNDHVIFYGGPSHSLCVSYRALCHLCVQADVTVENVDERMKCSSTALHDATCTYMKCNSRITAWHVGCTMGNIITQDNYLLVNNNH